MRDAIFAYGTLANATLSLATTGTIVYPGGAIGTAYIDLGTISSSSRFTMHTLDKDLYAVWRNLTAGGAAGSFTPGLLDSSTAAMTGTARSHLYPTPPVGTTVPTGGTGQYNEFRHRCPENVQEFICHSSNPTGTTTAYTQEAWFEHGPRQASVL
jgi:hypothetical protein